jgi:hypothetical protein
MVYKKLFLGLLIILLLIYFSATILYNPKYVLYIKPLIIPSFIIFAILNKKQSLTKEYLFFVLFFYLGETFMLLCDKNIIFLRVALLSYFTSYMALINLAYPFVKSVNLIKMVRTYNMFIVLLYCFFLFIVLSIIFDSVNDKYVTIIVVFNAISALILTITAFFFLGTQHNKKSSLYFFGALSIVLSDIYSSMVNYYLDNFILNFIERLLHFTGFFLIYLFTIEKSKPSEIEFNEKEV